MIMNLNEYLVSLEPAFENTFSKLNELKLKVKPNENYVYRSLSGEQLSEYLNTNKSVIDKSHNSTNVSLLIRANAYDVSKVYGLLNSYTWSKQNAIHQLIDSVLNGFNSNNTLSSLILVRSIIEQIGNFCLLYHIDFAVYDKESKNTEGMDAVIDFYAKLAVRAKGTRIDWEKLFESKFSEGKKKSYVPKDGTQDLNAIELLDGVDLLNKHVKGARKLYEFLCEFAHPNVGVLNLFIQDASISHTHDGIRSWKRVYGNGLPSENIRELSPKLLELLEITIASIEHFIVIEEKLRSSTKSIKPLIKKFVNGAITGCHPKTFYKNDPCPCYSGLPTVACCGRRYIHLLA